MSIDSTLIDPKCNADTSGEISIRITGGTAPYRYAWENGATTANRKNLKAGNYNVVVTDANGCTATWSFVLNDPAPINARVITTDPLCFGLNTGTATVDVFSTGPHTFLWSTGATASTIQNLGAGNYGLTVTNAIGCKASFPFTIIGPPTDLQVQLRGVDINCFGANSGEIRSTTTGGQQTYGYKWSTGATSADLLNLTAGTYALTVTDQNGCADTASVMIKQNPAISSTTTFSNPACFGQSNGQATVLASGGSPGYRYVWSTGQALRLFLDWLRVSLLFRSLMFWGALKRTVCSLFLPHNFLPLPRPPTQTVTGLLLAALKLWLQVEPVLMPTIGALARQVQPSTICLPILMA
ncbi:MAG: SprB repeat-containing protein [Haliscomenobacter sp.]|nr:SprB repeat-containing protein [Haliscomenobacter sp.]